MDERLDDEWEPSMGRHEVDEEVEVRVAEVDGRRMAVMVPRSVQRLGAEQTEVVHAMQRRALEAARIRNELEALALEARELGVPWTAIGWSVGTTPQAARKRWGGDGGE